jgi:hypothetical protein
LKHENKNSLQIPVGGVFFIVAASVVYACKRANLREFANDKYTGSGFVLQQQQD